jgi:hypothetical protein
MEHCVRYKPIYRGGDCYQGAGRTGAYLYAACIGASHFLMIV